MNGKPVKKTNAAYLLLTVCAPIALIVLGGAVGYHFFHDGGTGAVVCFMGPTILSVAWWILGPTTIWKMKKKKMVKDLEAQGFNRNQTFYGSNQTVVVDGGRGRRRGLPAGHQPGQLPAHGGQCEGAGEYLYLQPALEDGGPEDFGGHLQG